VLSLLVGVLAVSTSMSQPFLGALTDRLDGRIVAAGGAVLSSVLLSLVGVVPDLALTNRDQSWLRGRSTRRLDHCLPLGSGCPDGSGDYTPKG